MEVVPCKRVKYANEEDSSRSLDTNRIADDQPSQVEEDEFDEKDLPLLANAGEVRVLHHLLRLSFNFGSRVVDGVGILFLDPLCQNLSKIVLDCCSLSCKAVYLLKTQDEFSSKQCLSRRSTGMKDFYRSNDIDWFGMSGQELTFSVQKWSLTININWEDQSDLPSVIRIHYETSPCTPSLHWRPSAEGWKYSNAPSHCVYTPACPVNNRGLFPCQEPPSSMSSWECLVLSKVKYQPLLTSDEPGEIISTIEDFNTTYFYSSMILPMSTFAIIVGEFKMNLSFSENISISKSQEVKKDVTCRHEEYPCRIKILETEKTEDNIAVRMFSFSQLSVCSEKFKQFLSLSIKGIARSLGTFPFSRVDFVILPKYFPHLGLCSPNLIFLSPSVFMGDSPLYLFRLPHEITHYWFGLLVGAKDWLDEYLCEGFATFMEDILHIEIFKGTTSRDKLLEEVELRACLRLVTLQNEIRNVEPNLQVLNPEPGPDAQILKGGLEPLKPYTEMHYLKGYFFLQRLMLFVGHDEFIEFLKLYLLEFHGQLVTSDIFIEFYYDTFREKLDRNPEFESIQKLKEEWLKNDGLPAPFNAIKVLDFDLKSVVRVFPHVEKLLEDVQKSFDNLNCTDYPVGLLQEELKGLSSCQMILLLEKLLIWCSSLSSQSSYKRFMESGILNDSNFNPEVTHRICELVLINKDTTKLTVVQDFLENHQSLGVYLYGELMITEKRMFQKLARKLYEKQLDVLSTDQRKLLREMIH